MGYGGNYGFDVVTPYFWAVTPSTDLTFSPMWTTKQGPVADLEWRQRLAKGVYNIHGYGVYQFDPGRPRRTRAGGAVSLHRATSS